VHLQLPSKLTDILSGNWSYRLARKFANLVSRLKQRVS